MLPFVGYIQNKHLVISLIFICHVIYEINYLLLNRFRNQPEVQNKQRNSPNHVFVTTFGGYHRWGLTEAQTIICIISC